MDHGTALANHHDLVTEQSTHLRNPPGFYLEQELQHRKLFHGVAWKITGPGKNLYPWPWTLNGKIPTARRPASAFAALVMSRSFNFTPPLALTDC